MKNQISVSLFIAPLLIILLSAAAFGGWKGHCPTHSHPFNGKTFRTLYLCEKALAIHMSKHHHSKALIKPLELCKEH